MNQYYLTYLALTHGILLVNGTPDPQNSKVILVPETTSPGSTWRYVLGQDIFSTIEAACSHVHEEFSREAEKRLSAYQNFIGGTSLGRYYAVSDRRGKSPSVL